jgi:lysophospholipase L1-like esterase
MRMTTVRSRFIFMPFILLSILFAWQNEVKPDPDPKRFQGEIDAFGKWDAKNSYPSDAILFVGSSSIRMWNTYQAFPEYPVINRGFGGAHTSDMIYFYEQTIKKYKAGIMVVYIGDNDIAGGKPVKQVLEDYMQLIAMFKVDNPDCKVIYLPIKPSISRWSLWDKMSEVNRLIDEFNKKDKNLFYCDTATPMIGDSGRPKETLFIKDGLHLNAEGYALWQSLLQPLLEKIF